MPRVVFTELKDLQVWLERFGDPLRYTAYQTSKEELILEPMKSTQPLRYAYLKCNSEQAADQMAARLRERNYIVLKCHSYQWSTDREVGARTTVEELEE